MSTVNYNVNVNTSQGVQALNNLQAKVSSLNGVFGGLKSAIAGIAITQTISGLLRFADGIKDLSDATGIATENILGFQKAVQAFGGSAEGADKAILRLVQNVGEAAAGSEGLQYAFGRVGVSLNDLATMSEQDILARTIEGISKVSSQSEQAALKAQLLGKEFRNVATSGLAEAYAKAAEESKKYADSIARAAETQDKLDKAVGQLKISLLEVLDPMLSFVNSLDPEKITKAVDGFARLATVLVGFAIFGKIVAWVEALVIALGVAGVAAVSFGLRVAMSFTLIGKILVGVGALIKGFQLLFPETANAISDSFDKAYDSVKDFLGISKQLPDTGAGAGRGGQGGPTAEELAKHNDSLKKVGTAVRDVTDPYKNLRLQIQQTSQEFAKMNMEISDQINLNNAMLGGSLSDNEVMKAKEEIYKRSADAIEKLKDAQEKLTKEQRAGGVSAEYDKQITKIKELADVDAKRIAAQVENSQKLINIEKFRLYSLQQQIDLEKQMQSIQDDIAKSTMSEIEKKYYDIDAAARASAKAAIEAEAQRRGVLKLSQEEQDKYYAQALKGTEALKTAQRGAYEQSRTFASGWNKAFREYVDNASNAAAQAERIFSKFTQGIEDLIVTFTKTGKFEWKQFVASMAEELLRSQIKQLLGNIMGAMSGGGGILGGIADLFGGGGATKGQSANNPMFVYDVAGGGAGGGMAGAAAGGGGGIFDSIGKLFGGIGDSISGIFGGGPQQVGGPGTPDSGGFFDSLTSGIGDFFSGFSGPTQLGGPQDSGGGFLSGISDLFGGFFANGGALGAGKFGIAGEAGPEIISGPATVTPMSPSQNVTYNINAVDAASFKAMIAADPSFIHGIAMKGASGIPARR